jgi:hypothetical protein
VGRRKLPEGVARNQTVVLVETWSILIRNAFFPIFVLLLVSSPNIEFSRLISTEPSSL